MAQLLFLQKNKVFDPKVYAKFIPVKKSPSEEVPSPKTVTAIESSLDYLRP